MPLTVRSSARRRRKGPEEKLPERPGESSAQVMAPTRMKLRVRRRDTAAAAGGGQPEDEEEEEAVRGRESSGRSSRRKNTNNTSTAAAASSPAPSSSATTSARVMAAEEASPDSKCPICLDRFNNLAYLDRCLHRFCFPCIQEWSHNKAECPLCKQPFASILHSVRAEDDFKEYTLRPPPANSSVAATVAMVAAMASAARSDHQMRLMLRRHRGADGGEAVTRRRRRERGGAGRRSGIWEWYLDSPPLALPPVPHHPASSPVVAEDSEEGEDVDEQGVRGGEDLAERGVIFEGLTGLSGAVAPMAPNDRASRRLMTRLVVRQRLQREGGAVRWLRERETVAFRRALYRSTIRVRGVAGLAAGQTQRDITAESFRRNPTHLNRLRPWLRRELTVLYGAHGSLVDIVQRIIMARLARHGLEDTPTIEEELRPFLLARTDHFLHELVSFARSPLSLEHYDLQAVYEPPAAATAAAMELNGTSSSSDSSSVIAISEGEDEERAAARPGAAHSDVIQSWSSLSLAAWDDETPGPSYSTAEPPCSISSPPLSPAPQEASEARAEKREEEDECLIVGYKKPIAERTPELVHLSSDTDGEEEKKEDAAAPTEKPLPLVATPPPPLSYLPTIPPSTSGACRDEPEKDGLPGVHHAHSWSCSSGRNSVCTLSEDANRPPERWRDGQRGGGEAAREKRKKKRRRRGQERSGTLYNPNRSIYPAMMRHRSHSPSPFRSSAESRSPPPSPSPPASSWEFHCSQVSPLTSSVSSSSRYSSSSTSSSPLCSSPRPSSHTPPTLSPGHAHHGGEKPGGKRKYKSRHLDSDDKDPTWRPSSGRGEKDGRRPRGRRREQQRREGSSRSSRVERSPSVEIIYEGTVSDAPPAAKRRRRRHRKTQHSSSPVIITLDSDSSHDDDIIPRRSSSSSPISSQQTVDFSDLPPIPLVHAAGANLSAEIGELPVDILDRGSDGSDTEPAGRSDTMGPIAIDNSEDSDRDVDVENVDENGSPTGSDGDHGPMRPSDTKFDHREAGENTSAASDSRLLASILSDLAGPKAEQSVDFLPRSPPDARKKLFRDPCASWVDRGDWLAEMRRQSNDFLDHTDLPPCHSAARPPLPHRWLKPSKDVPPLLKQASPVRSHNRNTPPPLKHKDAGSPRGSPAPSADLQATGALNSHIDLRSSPAASAADPAEDKPTILPTSELKRCFLRGELATPSIVSSNDTPPSCHLATTDSHPAAPTSEKHSTNLKPTCENRSTPLEFNSFNSYELHSSSGPGSSPVDSHPVNSLADSTSRRCTNKTQSPEPPDLQHCSSVFSGVNRNDASPPVSVSSTDSRTQNPSSTIDSHYSGLRENPSESVSSSEERSVQTKAAGRSSSPVNLHPGRPKSTVDLHPGHPKSTVDLHPGHPKTPVDLHPSNAASDKPKEPSLVNHGGTSPPIDLHHLVPPVDLHSDEHLNHTALSSATFHAAHTKCSSQSEPTADSHSKLLRLADSKPHNHFSLLPTDPHPNRRDFRLPADNHDTSSPESPAADQHSAQWNTHTHSAT
ncbi:E3 ubiquitin-protein ligase Topors-like [Centropristis striata]|uniref:E3 ubiquitin-protein ligase Topors-like n=1 Tax=Centropristis striata TaxID=184440 RepID=UPI0027E11C2F|nr:E3 ubiquitin-protein ligase Topors-like [Centropristis striata]